MKFCCQYNRVIMSIVETNYHTPSEIFNMIESFILSQTGGETYTIYVDDVYRGSGGFIEKRRKVKNKHWKNIKFLDFKNTKISTKEDVMLLCSIITNREDGKIYPKIVL